MTAPDTNMAGVFNPAPRQVRWRDSRRKHLEHAGYKFDQHNDGSWCLRRPTGQILEHYKHLGHAVNRAEKEIYKLREYVINPKTTSHQKQYWGKVLKLYDTYEPSL